LVKSATFGRNLDTRFPVPVLADADALVGGEVFTASGCINSNGPVDRWAVAFLCDAGFAEAGSTTWTIARAAVCPNSLCDVGFANVGFTTRTIAGVDPDLLRDAGFANAGFTTRTIAEVGPDLLHDAGFADAEFTTWVIAGVGPDFLRDAGFADTRFTTWAIAGTVGLARDRSQS
jgi:hypothetical protein